MAGTDKTVKVTLVAVATPYAKGMNDASVATKKLGAEIDTVGTKTKGLEQGAGRASGAMKGLAIGAGALAATGLVAFMMDLFGRWDKTFLLETDRERVQSRTVKEQVGGEGAGDLEIATGTRRAATGN